MTDEKNGHTFTANLFDEIRRTGTIYGRDAVFEEKEKDDDALPADEFTFPEFVETIARAGYQRFGKKDDVPAVSANLLSAYKSGAGADIGGDDDAEELSIADCMVKGATNVVESINNPNAHRKAATSKHTTGGKAVGQNRKK